MTTDSLFTLRMFPAQSEEQARELVAQGGALTGELELRVLPVDAEGQVIAVAGPEEVERVLIDLRVLPPQAATRGTPAVEGAPEDTSGHQLVSKRPLTPDPRPMAPGTVWQLCPGVALRLPLDDQEVKGFLRNAADPYETFDGGSGSVFGVTWGAGGNPLPLSGGGFNPFRTWDDCGNPLPLRE